VVTLDPGKKTDEQPLLLLVDTAIEVTSPINSPRVYSRRGPAIVVTIMAMGVDAKPLTTILIVGMGLVSPLISLEGKLQAAALVKVVGYSNKNTVAETEQEKTRRKVLLAQNTQADRGTCPGVGL
jgi:hypothetical protein